MKFELKILGSNSATPAYGRNQTSQLLNINEKLYLIDCGEATQINLIHYGVKISRIKHIFISHLHGDHYLGLVGLLSSMNLNGRKDELMLFGPPPLKEIIDIHLKYADSRLNYPLIFRPTQAIQEEIILETSDVVVRSFPLDHRIPCTGFRFDEKHPPAKIKPSRSYAFCSDTVDSGIYHDAIQGVNLLYHEATFLHDMLPRARETFHTTSLQAGQIALKVKAGKLLIGHFSARYKELDPLLMECQSVFVNAVLALEGATFAIE